MYPTWIEPSEKAWYAKKALQDKSKTACEATYVHNEKNRKWKSVEQIDIKLFNILVMIVSLINMGAKINQKCTKRWFLLVF